MNAKKCLHERIFEVVQRMKLCEKDKIFVVLMEFQMCPFTLSLCGKTVSELFIGHIFIQDPASKTEPNLVHFFMHDVRIPGLLKWTPPTCWLNEVSKNIHKIHKCEFDHTRVFCACSSLNFSQLPENATTTC